MSKRKAKICLNTMVANESHVITRMLESCYKHIDYWVIQDNGSTDGTQELIQNFFKEKQIPGLLYSVPWKFPGANRDEALQTCLKQKHGCDWILRTDADESLFVEDEFDWSILDDKSIQSFQIFAHHNSFRYFRCWLWNATLPWRFKHDKRHEVIYLDKDNIGESFQRISLPTSFRHIVHANGRTSFDSSKFFNDALELERDMLVEKTMTTDFYHLFYLARSYHDAVINSNSLFPFGEDQRLECCRRSIFYFKKYVELIFDPKKNNQLNEALYASMIFIGDLYGHLKDDTNAIFYLKNAEKFCDKRNEHLLKQAELHKKKGNNKEFFDCTSRLVREKKPNPCPSLSFFVNNNAYIDTSNYINELHEIACEMNGIKQ